MAQFSHKTVPFLHKGMNWNSPVEKLQDGQVSWAKNVRVLEQGTVSNSHGHTQMFQVGPPDGSNAPEYIQYVHTMSRLNILSEAKGPGNQPAFDPALRRTYVVGGDENLYVFQDEDVLQNPTLNPVITPTGQWNQFSGNPISVIDVQPAGAAVAWKYISDSLQMVTVGYYPGDVAGSTMARCLTMGLDPPVNNASISTSTPGNLLGDYSWIFAFRRVQTGARSNPSAATRYNVSQPSWSFSTGTQVSITLPVAPNDPQTGAPDANVVVDVYRYGGNIFRWALVGSGPGGSVFVDNTPDENLLAAPSPPQATDATTGLTRFNLYRPFVTQDIARGGQGFMGTLGNGAKALSVVSGDQLNPHWLPGSTIYLSATGTTEVACTIYQVYSNGMVELQDDFSAQPPPLPDGNVTWRTPAGTLMAGQPLSHIWGPYGIGQSGSYVFACGDPNAQGTLYWCNGNDPDSTDIVNNIQVVSPSERLVTGCVYDGQPYVWSTERQFQIFPSLTVFGQFTTQEIAGAKGCWLEWSLSVQNTGFADQSVSWRGKDGIYDWSAGGGLQRLTDPLYSFFPHDNSPSLAPETIMPFLGTTEQVGNLDDTQPKYHRLCWFQGLLFYDFVGLADNDQVTVYSTLVWDSVNVGGGWVSLDQPFADTTRPVSRSVDLGANLARNSDGSADIDAQQQGMAPNPTIYGPAQRGGNLKVSWGHNIYDYYGLTRGFTSRFLTRAEDAGDPRVEKLWGDYWLDCTPLNSFTVYPMASFSTVTMSPVTVPPPSFSPGVRNQFPLDFVEFENAGGNGLISPTLGLDIRWIGADGQFAATINEWQPSFVAKPELIQFRASDRDDQGANQAKYLMGANIEADTRSFTNPAAPGAAQTVNLNVIIDGAVVATLSVTHNGQLEIPYAWEPVAGYEFQVQFEVQTPTVWWQLYKVSWIFEPWPDAVARKYPFMNLGTSGAKYIKGIVMPIETGGVPGTFGVWGDDADTNYTWSETTENLKKTGKSVDLPAPFVAHEIQFSTLTACRIWPNEAKVDFDPWPESSTNVSSFSNLGYEGAKFMQGAVIPMETGGNSVSLTVTSDCGQSVTLGPVSTPAGCKNEFAFSFSPCNTSPSNPFIAHEVQVAPTSDARVWYDEIRWIWEPEPELVATWVTQPTDHDFPTWHSMRDCFIAYRGGLGTPTLYVTTDYSTESYPLDFVAPGMYMRCYRVLKPQKAKWRSYRVEGCGLFRLYIKDCAVRVKEWGSTGPYISAQPFGDLSRTNGGARI